MTQPQGTPRFPKLLSEALGYHVDITPRRATKRERLEREITRLEKRLIDRITKGRTRGAGAGGFNRDVENITHQIRLAKSELNELTN